MWLNTRDAGDGADASRPGSVWAYGGQSPPPPSSSESSSSASAAAAAPPVLGAIGASASTNGGMQWRSRLLWNRTEPEEEEREEEALPSYLSYLQHPLTLRSEPTHSGRTASSPGPPPPGTPSTSNDSNSGVDSASTSSMRVYDSFAPSSGSEIEEKSKELALALQDFIVLQMQQPSATMSPLRGHPPLPPRTPTAPGHAPPPSVCGCSCDALRVRVAELTHQVHALQGQVTTLLKSTSSLNTSAQVFVPPSGAAGGAAMPPLPPPPSPHQHQHHHHMQANLSVPPPPHPPQQPPMPLAPPPSPVGGAGSSSGALTDRVSTLEGRQSAFQSQLAQIAKVLGVPAGKQSKNAQLKTLVQTLREEIDAKIEAAVNESEASFAANVREQTKQDALEALDERMRELASELASASASSPSTAPPSLSYDAILSALASEHEASLARLSAAFQELVDEESKRRAQLEQRVDSHFSRHEEWLQQLEGELGSRFEQSYAPPSTGGDWAAALRDVNDKLAALGAACEENRGHWRQLGGGRPGATDARQATAQPPSRGAGE